jgi:hypothetical protein
LWQLVVPTATAVPLSFCVFVNFSRAAWFIWFSGRSGLTSLRNFAAAYLLTMPLFTSFVSMGCASMGWSVCTRILGLIPALWFGVHVLYLESKALVNKENLLAPGKDLNGAYWSVFNLALGVPLLFLYSGYFGAVTNASPDGKALLSTDAIGGDGKALNADAPPSSWLLRSFVDRVAAGSRIHNAPWPIQSLFQIIPAAVDSAIGLVLALLPWVLFAFFCSFCYFLAKNAKQQKQQRNLRKDRRERSLLSTLKGAVGFNHIPPTPNTPSLTAVPAANVALTAIPHMFRQRSEGTTSESLLVQWMDAEVPVRSKGGSSGKKSGKGIALRNRGGKETQVESKSSRRHSGGDVAIDAAIAAAAAAAAAAPAGNDTWREEDDAGGGWWVGGRSRDATQRYQPTEYEFQHTHHSDISHWDNDDDDDSIGGGAGGSSSRTTVVARNVPVDETGTRKYRIEGLVAGNAYRVRVRCRNKQEWSEWSTASESCHTPRDTVVRSGEKLHLNFHMLAKAIDEHAKVHSGAKAPDVVSRSDPTSSESFLGRIGNVKDWVTVGWAPPHTPCSLLKVDFGAATFADGHIYGGDVVQLYCGGKILFGKSTSQYLGWSSDRNKGGSSYFLVKGLRAEERLREGFTFELESQRWPGCKLKLSSQPGSTPQTGTVYLMLHNAKTGQSGGSIPEGSIPGAGCSNAIPEDVTAAAAAASAAAGKEIVVSAARISTGSAPSLLTCSSVHGGIAAVSPTREVPLSRHSAEYMDIAEYIQQSISPSLSSPPRYSIISALKICSPVLQKYLVEVADVKQRNGRTTPLPRLRGRFSIGATKLDKSMNECYLFHGCKCIVYSVWCMYSATSTTGVSV